MRQETFLEKLLNIWYEKMPCCISWHSFVAILKSWENINDKREYTCQKCWKKEIL